MSPRAAALAGFATAALALSAAPSGAAPHDVGFDLGFESWDFYDGYDVDLGYSLDDVWAGGWRRLYDRHGRPDPDGAPLQRQNYLRGAEYEMDLAASDFLIGREAAWRRAETGARLRMQSLDEFAFVHAVQVKTRGTVGEHGWVGFRFDRRYGRGYDSDLLRVDFAAERIGGTPLFVQVGVYPRGEKEDIDAELLTGLRIPDVGELRLRLGALDLFTDASYALAEGRDRVLDRHLDMQGPPFVASLEALSARWNLLRAELYGGLIVPQDMRVWHPARPLDDHHRTLDGWMAAGLVEWGEPGFVVGATARHMATTFGTVEYADPTRDRRLDERETAVELYTAMVIPFIVLHLEARVRRLAVDGQLDPGDTRRGGEVRWLSQLRALWMGNGTVGADLAVMRSDRSLTGERGGRLGGSDHRLVTRCQLRFSENVWTSFGVGWDLDPGDGIYDGGGVTIVLDY